MSTSPANGVPGPDWDPRSRAVLTDQIAAYDEMRERCPVAHSDYLNWSLFAHADVMQAIGDHETFSNNVSAHISVPNGMDPPEHTKYRQIIDGYFTPERMSAFEPVCRKIAVDLVGSLSLGGDVELMAKFGENFALRMQSAFLGWPDELHEPLRRWVRKNHQATLAQDRPAMAAIATEFDVYIHELLRVRRTAGAAAPDDLTTALLSERIADRYLSDEDIVSILRLWTVGELSTISASVSILAHFLAANQQIQRDLRASRESLPSAIDEILRIHAPLISNRRITTREVEIGGRVLAAGDRVTLMWASANRDEAVFGDPDEFRLDRDPSENLLYGAGIHVCPGAPMARLELLVLIEELLDRTTGINLVPGTDPTRAVYPASGFTWLPLRIS